MLKFWKRKRRQENNFNQEQVSASEEWHVVESAEQILQSPLLQTDLYAVRDNISITNNYYAQFYLPVIRSFAQYTQQLPHPLQNEFNCPYGLLRCAFKRAIAALKCRRGYMLPIGANTETCYREQELWTYAVFTTAFLYDTWLVDSAFDIWIKENIKQEKPYLRYGGKNYFLTAGYYYHAVPKNLQQYPEVNLNADIAKVMLPEAGLMWLGRHDELYACWWQTLNHQSDNTTVLQQIIELAEDGIGPKPKVSVPQTCEPKEANEANLEIFTTKPPEDFAALSPTEHWLLYLKTQFQEQRLAINQTDAWVHRVTEGILLVMPQAWEWYAKQQPEIAQRLAQNQLLVFDELIRRLTASAVFISNAAQNTYLHRYFLGHWKDRHVLTGLLVKPEILFAVNALPPVNAQLHLDPYL